MEESLMAATADQRRTPDPQVEPRATNRRFSAAYEQKILTEYDGLSKLEKGALLRREGLYSSLITAWRAQRDAGGKQALARPTGRPKADPRDKQMAAPGCLRDLTPIGSPSCSTRPASRLWNTSAR